MKYKKWKDIEHKAPKWEYCPVCDKDLLLSPRKVKGIQTRFECRYCHSISVWDYTNQYRPTCLTVAEQLAIL